MQITKINLLSILFFFNAVFGFGFKSANATEVTFVESDIYVCNVGEEEFQPLEKNDLSISKSFGEGGVKIRNTASAPQEITVGDSKIITLQPGGYIDLENYMISDEGCLKISYKPFLW